MRGIEETELYLDFELLQVAFKQILAIPISFNSFKTFIILEHTHYFAE